MPKTIYPSEVRALRITDRKAYDHARYMLRREERLAQMKEYHKTYTAKGQHKPRNPSNRKEQQHRYYVRNIERIREYQKAYRETHREELKQRRRKRIERLWREHFDRKSDTGDEREK